MTFTKFIIDVLQWYSCLAEMFSSHNSNAQSNRSYYLKSFYLEEEGNCYEVNNLFAGRYLLEVEIHIGETRSRMESDNADAANHY